MKSFLFEFLFPPRCFGCSTHLLRAEAPSGCCIACSHTVHLVESPRCPICATPREVRAGIDELCGNCLSEPPPYDSVLARWIYDGAVCDAIRRSKASDDPASLFALIDSETKWFANVEAQFASHHWTTPPVHRRDLISRGWDPARSALRHALGARRLAPDALRKPRRSTKQARLGRNARRVAVRNAFVPTREICGDWVVFDDVMTTGATMAEMGRALRKAGARSVVGVVLARSV